MISPHLCGLSLEIHILSESGDIRLNEEYCLNEKRAVDIIETLLEQAGHL